jgi:hypothetical protein
VTLRDLSLLYLVAGLGCAVAIYRAHPGGGPRVVASAALAVPLWPLWAPIALTRPREGDGAAPNPAPPGSLADRVCLALREAAAACAGTSLEILLPPATAARLEAELLARAARHAELSALLEQETFDLTRAEQRVRALEASGATARALATARLELDNVRRLAALRDRDARALSDLAALVGALRTQIVLARFSGSSAEGIGGIVAEVEARVEGLGAALEADTARGAGESIEA